MCGQDYKSVCAVCMIFVAVVNTHTHRRLLTDCILLRAQMGEKLAILTDRVGALHGVPVHCAGTHCA